MLLKKTETGGTQGGNWREQEDAAVRRAPSPTGKTGSVSSVRRRKVDGPHQDAAAVGRELPDNLPIRVDDLRDAGVGGAQDIHAALDRVEPGVERGVAQADGRSGERQVIGERHGVARAGGAVKPGNILLRLLVAQARADGFAAEREQLHPLRRQRLRLVGKGVGSGVCGEQLSLRGEGEHDIVLVGLAVGIGAAGPPQAAEDQRGVRRAGEVAEAPGEMRPEEDIVGDGVFRPEDDIRMVSRRHAQRHVLEQGQDVRFHVGHPPFP